MKEDFIMELKALLEKHGVSLEPEDFYGNGGLEYIGTEYFLGLSILLKALVMLLTK